MYPRGSARYCAPEFLDLFTRRMRADQHPVAAAFVRRFHHQLFQIVQNELPVVLIGGEIGFDVWKNRLFAEVKLDHLGNVVVGDLVIRDACADGICQIYVPLAICLDDA